jgi:hypothetical protein
VTTSRCWKDHDALKDCISRRTQFCNASGPVKFSRRRPGHGARTAGPCPRVGEGRVRRPFPSQSKQLFSARPPAKHPFAWPSQGRDFLVVSVRGRFIGSLSQLGQTKARRRGSVRFLRRPPRLPWRRTLRSTPVIPPPALPDPLLRLRDPQTAG